MALLVNNTKFRNTEILAPQLYVRLQYVAFADGKKTSIKLMNGLSKADALSWKEVPTDLPEQLLLEMLDGENQDLLTIHNKVKTELELQGFEVTIDLN